MKVTAIISLFLFLPLHSFSQDYDHSMLDALEVLSGIKSGLKGASESLQDVKHKDKGHTMGYSEFTIEMLKDLSSELKEIEKALDDKEKNLDSGPGHKVNHKKAVQLVEELDQGFSDLEKELKTFGSKGGKDRKESVGDLLKVLLEKCNELEKKMQNIALK